MIRSWKRLASGALLAGALALSVGACGPHFDRMEITGVRLSKLGGRIDDRTIEVHEGMIVKAHIVAWNDDDERMPVVLRASDPSVVEVARVIQDDNYAFVGLRPGRTQIEVVTDGDVVHRIDAEVIPQRAQP